MSQFQKPNHLATPLDRIIHAKLDLPANFLARFRQLETLTEKVRLGLSGLVSDEVLATCRVVSCETHNLTLSTNNQTFANHLIYLSDHAIARLVGLDENFAHLKTLKIIVVNWAFKKFVKNNRFIFNLGQMIAQHFLIVISQFLFLSSTRHFYFLKTCPNFGQIVWQELGGFVAIIVKLCKRIAPNLTNLS